MKRLVLLLSSLITSNLYSMSGYQQQVVASGIILEASSEGEEGMQAVFSVIVNRSKIAGKTPLQILTRPGQFSSMKSVWNKSKPDFSPLLSRARKDRNWQYALDLVNTYEGRLFVDTTNGATHYHTRDIKPDWAKNSKQLHFAGVIGEHVFYSPTQNFIGVASF